MSSGDSPNDRTDDEILAGHRPGHVTQDPRCRFPALTTYPSSHCAECHWHRTAYPAKETA
ncbi:hypothetical protein SAMN04515671_2939 [Nakamurella panacisegetis]|uniref:Uncharacterized protein n=1 Tax=Nakamurella panacisegetis TaxID=1090615 RepID=A0A1H0PYU4_9ACTN|nr:hypothetical protein SAMN04515671_2939 [Nakamurella panacisegetis]